jgi:peptidyl-prolyl cis-trans isomerase C
VSEQASTAIEMLLERCVRVDEPAEADCRRYHAAHAARYRSGERAQVRHVLFAVTPGVDVAALRRQAEATLLEVRCHDGSDAEDRFGRAARDLSNCPSGAEGGALGWLERTSCVREFADEIFGRSEIGVLPRLVHTRFGLHVVEVLAREPGEALAFDAVHPAVVATLRRQRYVTELRRYLGRLAAEARLDGLALDDFERPLSNE